uniref:Ig-like domain-containing protein n=1 Tax=Zosterops lateralis melanops TaxID=1220523 RepID=A0A8D2PN31_ZOSLA
MSPFPGTPIQVDGRTSIPQDRHGPGWCPLSPTAAQTTQLLVEPPWMPAVLWDRVTLTCQGLGTSSDTTWYKDGQHWGQEGPENFVVTENGSYTCDRPGTGLSPPVRVSDGEGRLGAPAQAMLEGDTVTLRCRCRREMSVTAVRFCHGDKKVRMSLLGTELSLSPLQLHHSGPYHCRGWMNSWLPLWAQSVPVTVTVHGEHPTYLTVLWCVAVMAAPRGQVALSGVVAVGTDYLSFTRHWGSGALLSTSPPLELQHIGEDNDRRHYQCWINDRDSVAKSVPLNVTVLSEGDNQAGGDPTQGIAVLPHLVPALSVSPQCPWPMSPSPPVPCTPGAHR